MRRFAEHLFKGEERSFRDWALDEGAAYYVHALGEFAARAPIELQMRYMVDAVEPPPAAPARLFEFAPRRARWFRLVWSNPKYRVFQIVSRGDEAWGMIRIHDAEEAFQRGDLDAAADAAIEALRRLPNDPDALRIWRQTQSLLDQGFGRPFPPADAGSP